MGAGGAYPGAQPFERTDSGRFFGRTAEAEDLGQHWLENRVTYLYGPAGIGKTSLLMAGVLPFVERWNVSLLPVGSLSRGARSPVAALGAHNPYTLALLRSWSDTDSATLAGLTVQGFVRQYAQRRDQSVLIMAAIDQADDLFAGPESREEHRRYFFYQLVQALREPNLHLLVSIREDSLPWITREIGDGPQFQLSPLGFEAACQAAEGPGQFDAKAAAELVSRVRTSHIVDAGGHTSLVVSDDVEPALLQIACARLADSLSANSGPITMREMRRYGNVDAALSSYCGAVIATVAATHDVEAEQLRVWLIDTFVTVAGERNVVQESPTGTAGQPNTVARALEDRYMLRAHAERPLGSRLYRLISDRLIDPLRQAEDDDTLAAEDPIEYLRAAERALNIGELGLAQNYATRVLSIAPDTALRWHAEAQSVLGNLAYEQRRFEEAEQHYLAAARLFEAANDRIAVVQLQAAITRTLFDRGRNAEALSQLSAALSRAASDATVQLELTWVLDEATRRFAGSSRLGISPN
jgi:tetratricopeptide (TPR) repeat protein